MKQFPTVKRVMIDGTERPIQRPKDPEQQKLNYSRKKKRHTRKHLAAVDEKKRVLILSQARNGKVHDKRAHDEDDLAGSIPKEIPIEVDLGFQGLQKQYDNIRLPHRKPRGEELSDRQKEENRILSGRRAHSKTLHLKSNLRGWSTFVNNQQLKKKINQEWHEIKNCCVKIKQYTEKLENSQQLLEREMATQAVGLNSHGLYTGTERIFESISKTTDKRPIGKSDSWHGDLLNQMREEIPGVREPVVSNSTFILLNELRRFRHVVRSHYGSQTRH